MTKTEIEILQKFGDKLKKIRNDKSLTLRDLEAYTGIGNSMISKIERGKANITILTIIKLADALEVHPSELFSFKR